MKCLFKKWKMKIIMNSTFPKLRIINPNFTIKKKIFFVSKLPRKKNGFWKI